MIGMLLLVCAVLQFLVPALPGLVGLGTPIGDAARAGYGGQPPEQPLGVAFAIWGVIFALYAVFALIAAFRRDALTTRVSPPLAYAGAANVVWMLAAQMLDSQLLNAALLAPIIYFAWRAAAAFQSMRGMGGSAPKLVADATTGLLAGWASVAVAISTPLTIRTLTGLGATDAPWQMLFLSLAVAGALAYVFATRISASLWFFVAMGWGVANIALNNWLVTGMPPLALLAATAGVVIVYLRLTRGANPSTA